MEGRSVSNRESYLLIYKYADNGDLQHAILPDESGLKDFIRSHTASTSGITVVACWRGRRLNIDVDWQCTIDVRDCLQGIDDVDWSAK